MNTIEGNKIIAEFMARSYQFDYDLKYHSSWDWLMPVWVKFRKLELDDDVYLKDILDLSYDLWLCDTPEDFFKKLVPAIEWYNKEQSAQESDTTKAT